MSVGILAQEIGAVGSVVSVGTSTISPVMPGVMNWSAANIPEKHHTIQGKMFTAEVKMYDAALQLPVLDKDQIKRKLAEQILEKLLASEFIEYTQQKLVLEDCVAIRARFYAVPNDQVKILREKGYE